MVDLLKNALNYWPVIVPLLFTIAAYHDLKFAESSAEWYVTKGRIISLDSIGRLSYEYNGGGMNYASEYLNINEYLGNCKRQPLTRPADPLITKQKRCPSGRAWLPSFVYRWGNEIAHWESADSEERKKSLFKTGKKRASQILLKYSEGDRINVYYDPVHPEIAVLTPYSRSSAWYSDEFVRIYYLAIGVTLWVFIHLFAEQYGIKQWLDVLIYGGITLAILIWIIHLYSIWGTEKITTGVTDQKAHESHNEIPWEKTQGTVYVSYVQQRKIEGTKNLGPERASVVYKYQVNGVTYSHEYISDPIDGPPDEIVSRFPEKSRIDVLYDPRNPTHSTLELGSKK